MSLAEAPLEREGIQIHLARWKLNAGRFAEAHQHLNLVTNQIYMELKTRLLHNLKLREENPAGTNTPSVKIESQPSTNTPSTPVIKP
jgi:hypothetical protein